MTARDGDLPRDRTPAPDPGLRPFFDPHGRLIVVPAKRAKRLAVLDRLAQLFEPGERYSESEVNQRLRPVHDDVAMLRRQLVDEGFLDRAGGVYWRIGGTVTGI